MKENVKIKKNSGITLVALVVTIIVLLILAGVALSSVLSQDGIFHRAEQATDKYGQAKARETLELALGEAQMQKYEQGLTDEQLDNKINGIGEILPKENENSNNQNVIVDGDIFEIDRDALKIIDYIGPADGIIITASVTQNGNWQNPVATVTGTITKYGEGTVTSSSATATNGIIISGFPTTGGNFTIPNITKDTDITITAKDSEGHDPVTEVIKVRLVRDNTPPELSEAKAETILTNIEISVKAIDNESGLKQINYSVSPNTIKDGKATGTLSSGVPLEIEATAIGEYTIRFTATDNEGNTTQLGVIVTVIASDTLSLADLKKINSENYNKYIGKKVNYNPTEGGIWRVFYVEDSTNTFGDGEGTIYLKRDFDEKKKQNLSSYVSEGMTVNGLTMMKKLNPEWREYTKSGKKNGDKTTTSTFLSNELGTAGLCDNTNWTTYATGDINIVTEGLKVNYAIGAAPLEMWVKAQNKYRGIPGVTGDTIGCGIMNDYGYGYRINNGESLVGQQSVTLDKSKDESKVLYTENWQWLASPASGDIWVCNTPVDRISPSAYSSSYYVCPIVSISK